ncbi:hypothetical protein ACFV6B_04305 [Streptomyces microflavus]|uniref:hypothetical protein n=1 Tax=Streptomyces microflavus TaxID=1919 RepID=UPI001A2E0E34|nr:hypothetical protein [Streptomyces sp. MBT57]
MTSHPLLAVIPTNRLVGMLGITPVGAGLITVTEIPEPEWGTRGVTAWRPDGDTALVVMETTLLDPDDVPHTVNEFTEALRQVLNLDVHEGTR